MQGDEARPGAELISLGPAGFSPAVDAIAGPNNPRTYAMSVVLPNGEVALIGGAKLALEFTDATAIFEVGAFPYRHLSNIFFRTHHLLLYCLYRHVLSSPVLALFVTCLGFYVFLRNIT